MCLANKGHMGVLETWTLVLSPETHSHLLIFVVYCIVIIFRLIIGTEIFGNTPAGMPGVSLSFSSSCLACLCGSLSGKATGCSGGEGAMIS